MSDVRYKTEFFINPAVTVAQNLLGQILVFKNYKGIITETECYRGQDDPASHAYRGLTPRSKIMFEKPGLSYVYMIYGMYHCLNIVTEPKGNPSAVLIRSLMLVEPYKILLNGPGKICRELNITKEHNNLDITVHLEFYVLPNKKDKDQCFTATPRIGIKVGLDKLWRFHL